MKKILLILFTLAILLLSYYIAYFFKYEQIDFHSAFSLPMVIFALIWLNISILGGKLNYKNHTRFSDLFLRIFTVNLITFAAVAAFIFIFKLVGLSRLLVVLTFIIATFLEFIFYFVLYYTYKFKSQNPSFAKSVLVSKFPELNLDLKNIEDKLNKKNLRPQFQEIVLDPLKNYLSTYFSDNTKLINFLNSTMDLSGISNKNSLILNTKTLFNFSSHKANSQEFVANLHKINDFRRINKYLKTVNSTLKTGGIFLGKAETLKQRKRAIMLKYPPVISNVICIFDFLLNRIFPKLTFFKAIYFFLTKGKNRPLSKCEILGRLVFCGFELINITEIEDELYFIVKKVGEPSQDTNPSYAPLFQMKRRGKHGKPIYVYKFRTMHPYAEYLQDFMVKFHGYGENGKIKDDFRVTQWGKLFRKYWIDEVPQLINWVKGDMALVGVRPLSESFLKEYPESLKEKRFKYKPGCIPPYVSLNMQAVEEYIESEKIYLEAKEKHPFTTDFKFFFIAVYNILSRKIVSG